jgi:hypothetical protein
MDICWVNEVIDEMLDLGAIPRALLLLLLSIPSPPNTRLLLLRPSMEYDLKANKLSLNTGVVGVIE